jgi:phosphate uptake regulator
MVNEAGIVVREESIVPANEKLDAINDALKDMETKIQEMVNAAIEAKFAALNEKKEESALDEAEATKLYTGILKDKLKETLDKLF